YKLMGENIALLQHQLYQTNLHLWKLENLIRGYENQGNFGPEFIDVAREILHANDQRYATKSRLSTLSGSFIVEIKEHSDT
ncbi:MAG: hypothetical protein ACRDHZ_23525, partial [Ktedonobacteraceae bacterium]